MGNENGEGIQSEVKGSGLGAAAWMAVPLALSPQSILKGRLWETLVMITGHSNGLEHTGNAPDVFLY